VTDFEALSKTLAGVLPHGRTFRFGRLEPAPNESFCSGCVIVLDQARAVLLDFAPGVHPV
jgi:hypothetical protein